ncbi:MAG: Grx4 family monothiol glutaredoxin [Dokdonella sp.]
MSTDPQTQQRIEALLAEHRIVLFMKGTRYAPQCGFSAATTGLLNDLLDEYQCVDVLSDPAIREGIKEFGNWPTIPQLYVGGELVGGADIVKGMHDSGELHGLLGVAAPDRTPPQISISDAAATQIRAATGDNPGMGLFLNVDARFQPQFQLREIDGGEITSDANGIRVMFDLASAKRARGAVIDWVETEQGAGLSITLPLAPAQVHALDVHQLKRLLDQGKVTVIDVRSEQERALAAFPQAEVLDADSQDRLAKLDKQTPLAFLCHHGNSSRNAAEYFRNLGFRSVHNIEGGIEAWSQEIDSQVPRY